jgi:hypothetical protein
MSLFNSYITNQGFTAIGGDSVTYATESGIPYAYHTFTKPSVNQTFKILSGTGYIKVLVVAGGGGGGMDMGGGGGGGGVLFSNYWVSPTETTIPVYVGRGGLGGRAGDTLGAGKFHQFTSLASATNGENSIFGPLTAFGGGYGGSSYFGYSPNNGYGGNGGSGGGASGYSDGNTGRNGLGTPGQGTDGRFSQGQYYAGAGGGAYLTRGSFVVPPNVGWGIRYPEISPYYFGGGGGASGYSTDGSGGGFGGGGGGAVGTTPGGTLGINPGQPGGGGSINSQTNRPGGSGGENTGGGGGGGSHYNINNKGGEGGSGIVIVKYPMAAQTYPANRNIIQSNLGLHLDATDLNSNIQQSQITNGIWADISNNGLNARCDYGMRSNFLISDSASRTASTSLLNTDTHTICFSFRMGAASGTWDKIFGFPSGGSDRSPGVWRYPGNRWLHWRYDPGNTGVNISSNATSYSADPGGAEFNIDTWYYVCVSKNGPTATVYINGNKISSGSVVATKAAGSANIELFNTSSSSNMQMRHLHVYNRVLSDAEVASNYSVISGSLV